MVKIIFSGYINTYTQFQFLLKYINNVTEKSNYVH